MNSMDKCELNVASWIIIQHHYWHTLPEIQNLVRCCSPQFLLETFYIVISRPHDQDCPDFLFAKRSSILARRVLSLVTQLSVTSPEKFWAAPALWSHVMTSCLSHSCHSLEAWLFFSSSSILITYMGNTENALDLYVWTLLAAVLLSKPHPYFSQNVSFSS